MATTKDRQTRVVGGLIKGKTPYFETLYASEAADLIEGLLKKGARVHISRTPTGGFKLTCPGDGTLPDPRDDSDYRHMLVNLIDGGTIFLQSLYDLVHFTEYVQDHDWLEVNHLKIDLVGQDSGDLRLRVNLTMEGHDRAIKIYGEDS